MQCVPAIHEAHGALPDPAGLFNSSLSGKVRRAIDLHEGEPLREAAFTALVRAAVALNLAGERRPKAGRGRRKRTG